MAHFWRKPFDRKRKPQSTDEDSDLEKFYTDTEHALQMFEQLVTSINLPKRILVIHGLGGVGKSTLLKMYALTCRKYHIPAALVASEEALSPVDVLAEWEIDLNHDGITLPTFQKTLNHYRAIQARVETEATKGHQAASQIAGAMGKTVAKTAITMAASAIPVIGPLVGAVGGESAEAFVDWLRRFLSKPDMDLYFDPAKRLDSDFLNDLTRTSARQRIVLTIDTYEKMTALDDWMRELARKLPKNVLLVIAGRSVPAWDRSWQGWMGKVEIVELKEMTPDDIRTLVHRYYAHIRGGEPDPKQVEAIVQFARGLPMATTTVVQLWVKYGLEDFQTVRPQVVADLVDRLLEGVPSEMRPAFESAAALRYFNVESLSALLENGSAEALYAELRRWPFIRSRKEGLGVHDTMRGIMNEALKVRALERFRTLHKRAAAYYEAQMAKATGEERERHAAEQLYHHILADETSGIQLFQETAEALVLYRFIVRLRSLVKDVQAYEQEVDEENSLVWLKYYGAQLAYMEGKWEEAERIYQEIEEKQTERKLRAYILCKHGWILSQLEWRRQEGSPQKALELIQQAFSLVPLDRQLVLGHKSLSIIYEFQGDMERAEHHLQQMLQFYKEQDDIIGVITVCSDLRWHYMLRGNWKKMLEAHKTGEESTKLFPDISPVWKEKALRVNWGHIWMGRYREYGDTHREIVKNILPQIVVDPLLKTIDPLLKSECLYRLAFGEGMQRRFPEAHKHFGESFAIQQELGLDRRKDFQGVFRGFWGAIYTKQGEFEEAERYLGEALAIKQEAQDILGIPEVLLWLGELYEIRHMWGKAHDCYRQCLEEYKVSRPYFDSCALTGMVRVRYSQQQYDLIPSLFNQAESLAQQNEFNDHLASQCLTRGHLVWDGNTPEYDSGFDAAFRCYQKALIYALRYNCFLLDEAVQGNVPTALQSLIPHCMEKEGHRMLVALRDWWQSGTNDVGTQRADTISLVEEGIPLLEAEHIVRERDFKDSMHQNMVIDLINKAIYNVEKSSRQDP